MQPENIILQMTEKTHTRFKCFGDASSVAAAAEGMNNTNNKKKTKAKKKKKRRTSADINT